MDQQPEATRIKLLEETVASHGERITAHGREIDELREVMTEIRVSDKHRDESMRRMEGKLDRQDVKLDTLRQDLLAKTTGAAAGKWDRAVWLVIAALIGAALVRLGIG